MPYYYLELMYQKHPMNTTGQLCEQLCDHGVLFQNAEGNINMGFWFDDPDITKDDGCWYNILAREIRKSLQNNEGVISIDEELKTRSCYVELIRKSKWNMAALFLSKKIPNAHIKYLLKSPSWIKWSKSYRCSDTNEVSSDKGI